ncbi:hypothetical protein SAMN05192561_101361 [Halopenitus malekzadehii]|uniref:Uncharacterized protein n=1 Tax=Halopenitus malekzadehii TaxID=1267564 RepID=A0A1H6HR96_9EURY|nr:hypothetical protein [Halopenitus malekzadehii]SEH38392.1 hypothetical protein SAMN05192561_101361 [Halopenitus malekzadehii]
MRALPVLCAAALVVAAVMGPAGVVGWGGGVGTGGSADPGESIDEPTIDGEVTIGSDRSSGSAGNPAARITQTGGIPQAESNGTDENDTRIHVLGPPIDRATTVSIAHHGASLGPASRLETTETTAEIGTAEIIERVSAAESARGRERRLVAAKNAIREAETTLYERQHQAIEAHTNGELTDQEFVIELARISSTAEVLRTRLEVLNALASETPETDLQTESLAFRLTVYSGPVRDYAVETLRGGASPDRIAVETHADGMVLAAIDGDQYLREVYRGDRWDRAAEGSGRDSQRALDRTLSAYPRIDERSGSADTLGTGGVTRVTVPFDGGRLRTFVSAGDGDIFIEHQQRDLETFADGDTITTTQDGIDLVVERTYPAGPVRVQAIDRTGGDPIANATVTVAIADNDSREVGTTDRDGELWLLSPDRPHRVTVVDDPRVAWISEIRPTDLPRVPEPSSESE